MEGYDRMIAYISAYEGGIQNRTVGFLKMERWEGKFRLDLHIKGIYGLGGRPLLLSAMARAGKGILKSRIDTVKIIDGKGDLSYEESQDKIGEKSLPFCDLCGFVLTDSGELTERFFLTYWGEEPFSPECLREKAKPLLSEERKAREEAALWEETKETSIEPPVKEEEILVLNAAEIPEQPGRPAQERPENLEEHPPIEKDEDFLFSMDEKYIREPMSPWRTLCKCYPKDCFQEKGGKKLEILRIKPQDIGRLPRENWIFGNNSFLLHGFYQYRYLVLIRDMEKDPERYLLGVPGLYSSGEKQMAAMFGFSEFMPSQSVEKGACFGYWYTPVNIGNT